MGFLKEGKGRAWNKNGVHILHLQGSYPEMAGQHGALLKHVIPYGALTFLSDKNQKIVEHSFLGRKFPALTKPIVKLIELLQYPMSAHVPAEYKEESYFMAQACGMNWKHVQQTSMQADTLILPMRHSLGRFLMQQIGSPVAKTSFPGCTSAVALKEHTKSNSLIHARNMDYPSVGYWDPHPAVLFCDPDDGQRIVSIMTAGLHTTGITAMNESGLTLSAHFHCSKEVSLFGTPIHIIGSEVMRRAHNLDEAINIVRAIERAGSWSLVISSAKENRAVVLEIVHGRMFVRDAQDTNGLLANSNKYRTEELNKNEILLSTSAAHDFEYRYQRAMDILKEAVQKGGISERTCARLLGDQLDLETGQVRAHGNTIAVVTTVTSMISQLELGKFWLGQRTEAPVSMGPYLELNFDENFENFAEKTLPTIDAFEDHIAPQTIRQNPKLVQSLSEFRKAYVEYQNHFDTEAAYKHLKKAVDLNPSEGHFHMAAGHMCMKLANPQQALKHFEDAKNCKLSKHMLQTLHVFAGHAHDALGNRQVALAEYKMAETLSDSVSPQLQDEIRKCKQKKFTLSRSQDFAFDLQYCDCFEYP